MGLKSTRKLLSFVIAVVIAAGVAGLLTSMAVNLTFAKQGFIEKIVSDESVVSACEKQLDEKYKALSLQCGIPERVFLTVKNDYPVADSLKRTYVLFLFSSLGTTGEFPVDCVDRAGPGGVYWGT